MIDRPFDCERTQDLLPLFVGSDLEGASARRVEEHLASCAPCRDEAARAEAARRVFFEVALADGAEPISLWPDLARRIEAERGAPSRSRGRTKRAREAGAFALPLTGDASGVLATSVTIEPRRRPVFGARRTRAVGAVAAGLIFSASAALVFALREGLTATQVDTVAESVRSTPRWVVPVPTEIPVHTAALEQATDALPVSGGLRPIGFDERLDAHGTQVFTFVPFAPRPTPNQLAGDR